MDSGQVTVFVFIGIVLLAGVALSLRHYGAKSDVSTSVLVADDLVQVRSFVEACMESTLRAGVRDVARRGGFYPGPAQADLFGGKVSYLRYRDEARVPRREDVEASLESYVEDAVWLCLDYSSFDDRQIAIEEGNVSAQITLHNDSVVARVEYPLIISSHASQVTMSGFEVELPTRLEVLRRVAARIAAAADGVPISVLDRELRANHLTGAVLIDNATVAYVLQDRELTFAFAADYGWDT